METLEALAARLETTRDIGAIVRTMKALSAVSIRQYEKSVEALATFQRSVELGLHALLREGPPVADVFPGTGGGRRALILIGSDRGLCGRFNEALAAHARDTQLTVGERPPLVLATGLRLIDRLRAMGHPPDATIPLPASVHGLVGAAQGMIVTIERWHAQGGLARLDLCHNRRAGAARVEPQTGRVLPEDRAELARLAAMPWPARGLPMHRMERAALHRHLMRQRVFVRLYRGLAESLAGEHAARLAAMQAAAHNIEEREEALNAEYRRIRQENITTELMDIVAGVGAAANAADRGGGE